VSEDVVAPESNAVVRAGRGTVEFIQAVRSELYKVTWPAKQELFNATRMIVILSVVLGLAIGWMDLLFNLILVDGVAGLSR
jgi:preprotein translocase SecE subunit